MARVSYNTACMHECACMYVQTYILTRYDHETLTTDIHECYKSVATVVPLRILGTDSYYDLRKYVLYWKKLTISPAKAYVFAMSIL
jgi:hypothetical protein